MEYDPILNWNCQSADPAPEEFKRKLHLRKNQLKPVVQSLSTDDGLKKNPWNFPSLNQRLELQKNREVKLDTENPRFIMSLKYSIKKNATTDGNCHCFLKSSTRRQWKRR